MSITHIEAALILPPLNKNTHRPQGRVLRTPKSLRLRLLDHKMNRIVPVRPGDEPTTLLLLQQLFEFVIRASLSQSHELDPRLLDQIGLQLAPPVSLIRDFQTFLNLASIVVPVLLVDFVVFSVVGRHFWLREAPPKPFRPLWNSFDQIFYDLHPRVVKAVYQVYSIKMVTHGSITS